MSLDFKLNHKSKLCSWKLKLTFVLCNFVINYLPYLPGKSGSRTAGMTPPPPMCERWVRLFFHSWWWGCSGGAWASHGDWSWNRPFFVCLIFSFRYILWQLDKYSVHSSVTVTIVTRYFFILHNQQCHDGGGRGRVGGWAGLWGLLWGVQCDMDRGSPLVGSAPFRLLPLSVTYVQKAIKMLLKWTQLTPFDFSCV